MVYVFGIFRFFLRGEDIIFLALLVFGTGRFLGSAEYSLIAFEIVAAPAVALDLFLGEYLLYRYDHDDNLGESEE